MKRIFPYLLGAFFTLIFLILFTPQTAQADLYVGPLGGNSGNDIIFRGVRAGAGGTADISHALQHGVSGDGGYAPYQDPGTLQEAFRRIGWAYGLDGNRIVDDFINQRNIAFGILYKDGRLRLGDQDFWTNSISFGRSPDAAGDYTGNWYTTAVWGAQGEIYYGGPLSFRWAEGRTWSYVFAHMTETSNPWQDGLNGYGFRNAIPDYLVMTDCGNPIPTSLKADVNPFGNFDAANCDKASGWAWDADAPDTPIKVHIYATSDYSSDPWWGAVKKEKGAWEITANVNRPDLPANTGGIVPANHGWEFQIPDELKDGRTWYLYSYGINLGFGGNERLLGNPKAINCPPAAPGQPQASLVCESLTENSITLRYDLTNAFIGSGDVINNVYYIGLYRNDRTDPLTVFNRTSSRTGTYRDDNGGAGLTPGTNYTYSLRHIYPGSRGGWSSGKYGTLAQTSCSTQRHTFDIFPSAIPLSGNAPLTVNFSYTFNDSRGDLIANQTWTLYDKDGSTVLKTDNNATTNYTYGQAGTYRAQIRATCTGGLSDTESVDVTVSPPPPPSWTPIWREVIPQLFILPFIH